MELNCFHTVSPAPSKVKHKLSLKMLNS